jgi:acylphosphatase
VPAYRYVVRGVVQGVGFRYFVSRQATMLGLAGHARNCSDGSVEVVAEGETRALAELESRLRAGPAVSEVETLEREVIEPRGVSDFHIL